MRGFAIYEVVNDAFFDYISTMNLVLFCLFNLYSTFIPSFLHVLGDEGVEASSKSSTAPPTSLQKRGSKVLVVI